MISSSLEYLDSEFHSCATGLGLNSSTFSMREIGGLSSSLYSPERDFDEQDFMIQKLIKDLKYFSRSEIIETTARQEGLLEKQEDLLKEASTKAKALEQYLTKEALMKMLNESKTSYANLEKSHDTLSNYYATLDGIFKALKVSHEDLKASNTPSPSKTSSITNDSSSSPINSCDCCRDININAIANDAKYLKVIKEKK